MLPILGLEGLQLLMALVPNIQVDCCMTRGSALTIEGANRHVAAAPLTDEDDSGSTRGEN